MIRRALRRAVVSVALAVGARADAVVCRWANLTNFEED